MYPLWTEKPKTYANHPNPATTNRYHYDGAKNQHYEFTPFFRHTWYLPMPISCMA